MNSTEALEAIGQAVDTAKTAMRQFDQDSPSFHYWKGRLDMAQAMMAWLACGDAETTCERCGEPLTDHTWFGRVVDNPDVWHRHMGQDARPSDA